MKSNSEHFAALIIYNFTFPQVEISSLEIFIVQGSPELKLQNIFRLGTMNNAITV